MALVHICCENCKFGLIDSKTAVVCRRYPPMITKVEGTAVTSHFPLVHPQTVCGEHKLKVNGKGR